MVLLYYLHPGAKLENGGQGMSAQQRGNVGLILLLTAEAASKSERR